VVSFEQGAALLRDLGVEAVWGAANDGERRVLIEQLIDSVTVFPDHLEVRVGGAPPLNVLYSEVGMKESENVRVGGPTPTISDWRLRPWSVGANPIGGLAIRGARAKVCDVACLGAIVRPRG
jgi:hypothetical protein